MKYSDLIGYDGQIKVSFFRQFHQEETDSDVVPVLCAKDIVFRECSLGVRHGLFSVGGAVCCSSVS